MLLIYLTGKYCYGVCFIIDNNCFGDVMYIFDILKNL